MKHNDLVQFIVQLQTPGALQGSIPSYLSTGKYKQLIFNKERYRTQHMIIFGLPFVTLHMRSKMEGVWKGENQHVILKQVRCMESCAYGKRPNAPESRYHKGQHQKRINASLG